MRNTLRTWSMRMLNYRVETLPADEAARCKVFEFAQELGIETIVASPDPALLPELDKLASEFAINVAVDDRRAPKIALAALQSSGKRIGVQLDIGPTMITG